MAFLLLALSMTACETVNGDQPSFPLDLIGSSADVPSVLTEEPAAPKATPVSTTVKRKDCVFLDPDRAQDAEGNVQVKCGETTTRAKATYLGEGAFEFEIEEKEDIEGS